MPKRRCIYQVLWLLCLAHMAGSNAIAQEIIQLNNQQQDLLIGRQVYYLIDEEKNISFNDLLSGHYDTAFRKFDMEVPNLGNKELSTWNKFTVVNTSNSHWVLSVGNYSLDSLTFCYKDSNGLYQQIISGRSRPFSTRKYKTTDFIFDLPVAAGDTATFYLRVNSYFMQYPLQLMTNEQMVRTAHLKDMVTGFYFGFLIFIVLYNFFVFLNVRDRTYLLYILYVIAAGLMIAQLKGQVAMLWGDRLHFLWDYAPLIIAISGISTIIFTQQILETRKHAPKLHRVLSYIFLPAYLVVMGLSIGRNNLAASILNQTSGILGLFFFYATAIVVYRKGNRYARFYIAACWAYFLGVVIYVLKAFTLLPFTSFTNNAIEFGSTIEMVMFSFMLADKINAYKKEKAKAQNELLESLKENEKLIREQNKMLEEKVNERTLALQKTLHALELSEEELRQKNEVISHEKEKSDKLLLNILPFETAQELKDTGATEAKMFEEVTVMFTDFKGFTMISEKMEPGELVAELDQFFRWFDDILDKYDIEKIKTIGDSYMAAAGLPAANPQHAIDMVKAAMEIATVVNRYNAQRRQKGLEPFEIRIGIHTGPVIAGVVGKKKFAYDIWGDTVNTASRMESSSAPGRVNISGTTYHRVKHVFTCTPRGKVPAKNKGDIEMYFVEA